MNAYSLPLQIFRNAEFVLAFSLANADASPMDVGGYNFAFILAPIQGDGSFGTPILTKTLAPVSPAAGGSFVLSPTDTATLSFLTQYNWRVLSQPPSSSDTVLLAGLAAVTDNPAFPS